MRRTEVRQEIRKMRFEETCGGEAPGAGRIRNRRCTAVTIRIAAAPVRPPDPKGKRHHRTARLCRTWRSPPRCWTSARWTSRRCAHGWRGCRRKRAPCEQRQGCGGCSATLRAEERFQLRDTRLRGPTGGGFLAAGGGFPSGPGLGTPARSGLPFGPVMLLVMAEKVQARPRVTESHPPALRPQLQAQRPAAQPQPPVQRRQQRLPLVLPIHQPVPLQRRLQVLPQRVVQPVLLHPQPRIDVPLPPHVLAPRARRRHLQHEVRPLPLLPYLSAVWERIGMRGMGDRPIGCRTSARRASCVILPFISDELLERHGGCVWRVRRRGSKPGRRFRDKEPSWRSSPS